MSDDTYALGSWPVYSRETTYAETWLADALTAIAEMWLASVFARTPWLSPGWPIRSRCGRPGAELFMIATGVAPLLVTYSMLPATARSANSAS